jgi:hypothetical protein
MAATLVSQPVEKGDDRKHCGFRILDRSEHAVLDDYEDRCDKDDDWDMESLDNDGLAGSEASSDTEAECDDDDNNDDYDIEDDDNMDEEMTIEVSEDD